VKFQETSLHGALLIEPERIEDERGFFARTWCQKEFAEHGLCSELTQCNVSFNRRQGTVRGMHYQRAPHAESKLVRCTLGAIFDVMAAELSAENRLMLYIPEGVAHGFQTRTDNSEVFYQMTRDHHPESSAGFRWNDPAIGVRWPQSVNVISKRDAEWPDLT
jgi:dTDP-4-dehydrorhamnose 3,5-epimerase